jgi:hypothetical protein
MDNIERSQGKNGSGWQLFLEEAQRRFAEAQTTEERRGWRDSILRFKRLIRRGVKMPRKQHRLQSSAQTKESCHTS